MKKELLIPSALALVLAATTVAPSFASDDDDNDGYRKGFNAQVRVQSDDDEDGERGGKLQGFFRGWFKGKHLGEARLEAGASLESRITRIIAKYDANKDRHVSAYTKLQTNLVNFENRVEAAGYNTDTLEADLVIFDAKVAQFKADYGAYIAALRVALDMVEGDSTDAEVKAQLQVAKDKLLVAKTSGMAARDYYKVTIKADVKALKIQVEADADALLSLNS